MRNKRENTIEITKTEFQKIGYELIDTISDFLKEISDKPVTTTESTKELQNLLDAGSLPENGIHPEKLLSSTSKLLFDNSLFNGHPKCFGFITSSATPIGALADLLTSSVNPNVGAQILSPLPQK